MAQMKIEVEGLAEGRPIPRRYTGDGDDVSPAIRWDGLPDGTREVAVLVEDPDAPGQKPFVHWVACGIPGRVSGLPEGLPRRERVDGPLNVVQGRNDFGTIGYSGPAPPPGDGAHHYYFKVYALDSPVMVEGGCSASELKRAMRGHVLAEAAKVGTYSR